MGVPHRLDLGPRGHKNLTDRQGRFMRRCRPHCLPTPSLQLWQDSVSDRMTHCHLILLCNSHLTLCFLEARPHRPHPPCYPALPRGGEVAAVLQQLWHQTHCCKINPTFPLACTVSLEISDPRTAQNTALFLPFKNTAPRWHRLVGIPALPHSAE